MKANKHISILFIFFALLLFYSCKGQENDQQSSITAVDSVSKSIINETGTSIKDRFNPPEGFYRESLDSNSFAFYLRNLPLKKFGAAVKYYDGSSKRNQGIYISVVDMEIDNKDLQQCADAVMRLKAEYHYARKEYDKIHFNFLSDGKPRYYKDYAKGDYSYPKFRKYLNYVFSYANTASLHNEMNAVAVQEMKIGDVFIQKTATIGHAIIIVDMLINENGEKMYLLAQSYMPAQETQILVNPNNTEISPWYLLENGHIHTPEWTFEPTDLRRFN